MANEIQIPSINPIKLVQDGYTPATRYNQKHFDSSLFTEQLRNFQQTRNYYQKFQTTENIYFQIIANFGPISCKLIDCNDNEIVVGTVATITTSIFTVPYAAFSCTINLSGIPEGIYWVVVNVGTTPYTKLISEPIHVANYHANTMLFEYNNSINDFGAIFQNGEIFSLRIESFFKSFTPGSNDVVFEDEPANVLKLSASPFRQFKLAFGEGIGVPDWLIDKVNRLFACDSVLIDGKYFTKAEGAKLDPINEDNYAMSGWSLDVRESKSREGLTITNNITQDQKIVVIHVVDTTFFGPLNNASQDIILKEQ